MKKTLLITTLFPPQIGGVQNYLYNISKHLPQDKIIVLADSQNPIKEKEFDRKQSFKIFRQKFTGSNRFLNYSRFFKTALKIINQEKIEMILSGHLAFCGKMALLFKKIYHLPYFVFTYGLDIFLIKNLPFLKKKQQIKALKKANKIVVLADFIRQELKKYNIPDSKIIKVWPGVDWKFFKPGLETTGLRQKLDLKNKKIILTCGRIVERKNHLGVISALPEVIKKIPNLVYLILSEGPFRKVLEKKVSELGLEKYVKFIGQVDFKDLPLFYNLADVFIMASRELPEKGDIEGFGIVFLEAAACGKPSIGGKSGGMNEAILDGQTGILVDPENIQEISSALIKLLEDENLARKLGKAGRERVIEQFDWSKIVNEFKKELA